MSLANRKQLHDFIWTELLINYQIMYRVNDPATKEKHPEIIKGYPIFEWIPGISITDKEYEFQNEDNDIASTHEYENYDDNTENG